MRVASFASPACSTLPPSANARFSAVGSADRPKSSAPKFGFVLGGCEIPLAIAGVCGCIGCGGLAAVGGVAAWKGRKVFSWLFDKLKGLTEGMAGFIDKTAMGKAAADAVSK